MKIASLLPAATEIVCALGSSKALCGVSHECDFPRRVRSLPVLTRTRRALPGTVDQDRWLHDLLSPFEVDVDALVRVRPDVIVTQDLCDVCAVDRRQVLAALGSSGLDAKVVNLAGRDLAGVRNDFLSVGTATGQDKAARALVREMDAGLDELRVRTRNLPRKRLLTLEWLDPPMPGGLWTPELVETAGGRALHARSGEKSRVLTRQDLVSPVPDIIVVKPCGYPTRETLDHADQVDGLIGAMVDRAGVFVADGSAYFNRPGPRLLDSARILAAICHPGHFPDYVRQYGDDLYCYRGNGRFIRLNDSQW